MRATLKYLQKNRVPAQVVAEVAEFINAVETLTHRLGMVAGGIVGLETVLEHHKLLSPEIMEIIKPLMVDKMTRQEPEQAPEQKPSEA